MIVGVDVNHDYDAAPGVGDRRLTPLKMGSGMTLTTGSITSEYLNALIETSAKTHGIPIQRSVSGRDTGTDAMAGVFASIDAAATSIGFPIRNMHTISETGHTGDVLAAVWTMVHTLEKMDEEELTAQDFASSHIRLDQVEHLYHSPLPVEDEEE